jgi:hypothetical protein
MPLFQLHSPLVAVAIYVCAEAAERRRRSGILILINKKLIDYCNEHEIMHSRGDLMSGRVATCEMIMSGRVQIIRERERDLYCLSAN